MLQYPVWMNHARKASATQVVHADDFVTGWQYNNECGRNEGFRDDMYESDFRGHSLDAPDRLAAGAMESYSNRYACPLQLYVRRDA